jgi:hypothetical protein
MPTWLRMLALAFFAFWAYSQARVIQAYMGHVPSPFEGSPALLRQARQSFWNSVLSFVVLIAVSRGWAVITYLFLVRAATNLLRSFSWSAEKDVNPRVVFVLRASVTAMLAGVSAYFFGLGLPGQ